MTRIFIFALLIVCFVTHAQTYTPSRIFAHNDYLREKPFHTAYDLGVGYIEADVFLKDGELMVAHLPNEIVEGRTLRALYLDPLLEKVNSNGGLAYSDSTQKLTLMIDLKTEGVSTLNTLVVQLKRYKPLTSSSTLQFMISGSVPDPEKWALYPSYIFFDGRPGIKYSKEQLRRISMISTSFRQHVNWDGRRALPKGDRKEIVALMEDARANGKSFRFWATPDFPAAWKVFMDLNMDVILTDKIEALAQYFEKEGR